MSDESIVLETGAGEMEVLEFLLGQQRFGVSVLKIEAIEQFDASRITLLPNMPPGIQGTLLFRQRTIPLIDLGVELGCRTVCSSGPQEESGMDNRIFLIVQFNDFTVAFTADGVERIHRVQVSNITPLSEIFGEAPKFTGSFNVEGREVLLVDMEKIVIQLDPRACGAVPQGGNVNDDPLAQQRAGMKILLAEDSSTTRSMMTEILSRGGYTSLTTCKDGKAALDRITALKAQAEADGCGIESVLNVVITDIEMPAMDGLTLCKSIRKQLGLKDLPILLYSTQVTPEMTKYFDRAGASGYISKPQIAKLVELIDGVALQQAPQPT
jgi:two-component system chemotaxis response regulator CheV